MKLLSSLTPREHEVLVTYAEQDVSNERTMGLKRWWRQHGAQPKDGGRVVPDSMTDMLAQLYTKQPDYRYLSKQLMTYNEMMQLQQATPRHTVRAQNESVIQCSCGDYFLRERYPGHIADVV